MEVSAIVAIAAFGVLFIVWVVLPSRLRKRHENTAGNEIETDE
jgi:hypothetical protein